MTDENNTYDPVVAIKWLQHSKYEKYTMAQKLMILAHLSEDVRVQDPDEYDDPRVEHRDPEFFELFGKGALIPDEGSGDDD